MPWQTIPGIIGKVYQPDSQEKGKRHQCAGCFRCQNCSAERCRVCREEKEAQTGQCACTELKEVLS